MALPGNMSLVWVRGTFLNLDGSAMTGRITFSANVVGGALVNPTAKRIIGASPFSGTLDSNTGYFQVQLPATNDPDVTPVGFTYSVVEPTGRKYSIVVPFDAPALDSPGDPLHGQQVIELSDIVPAPGASGGTAQLLRGRGVASMDVDGTNHLVVTYSDDTTEDLGVLPGGALANMDDLDTTGAAVGGVLAVTQISPLAVGVGANPIYTSKVERALRSKIERPGAIAVELSGTSYNLWQRLTPGQWLRTSLTQRANTNGGNVQQVREYRLITPVLRVDDGDASIVTTGTWATLTHAEAFGGGYRHASVAGATASWTSPAATTRVGANTVLATNGGLAKVTINGDPTRARLLPTAQDLVERGLYPATILTSGGGTLAATDRVLDCYVSPTNRFSVDVLFADDLPPGAHAVVLTATGYQRAAATGARAYLSAMIHGQAQQIGAAGTTAAPLARVESEFESATEYAFNGAPTAAPSDIEWFGSMHDNEAQDALAVSVDGAPVTLTEATPVFPAERATITRATRLLHPGVTGDVADVVTVYELTRDGVTIDVTVTWQAAMTIGHAYAMLPLSGLLAGAADRSRFDRGDLLEWGGGPLRFGGNAGTDTYNGQSRSGAAWMWESGGRLAAGVYLENPDEFTNGWAMSGDRFGCIEDRNGIVTKVYLSRVGGGGGANFETTAPGDVWHWRAHYLFGTLDSPERTFG